jgi:acetyltransferase EpsM
VVLLGAGGHGIACADLVKSIGHANLVGFLDDFRATGEDVFGSPVLGAYSDWATLDMGAQFLVSLGQIGDDTRRFEIVSRVNIPFHRFTKLVSHASYVSESSTVGAGSAIFPQSVVGANVSVGRHCIVNSGSVIEHGSLLGDFSHIAPGAVVCGGVEIGEGSFIGAGAVVLQGLSLPPRTVVPAGRVVRESP